MTSRSHSEHAYRFWWLTYSGDHTTARKDSDIIICFPFWMRLDWTQFTVPSFPVRSSFLPRPLQLLPVFLPPFVPSVTYRLPPSTYFLPSTLPLFPYFLFSFLPLLPAFLPPSPYFLPSFLPLLSSSLLPSMPPSPFFPPLTSRLPPSLLLLTSCLSSSLPLLSAPLPPSLPPSLNLFRLSFLFRSCGLWTLS